MPKTPLPFSFPPYLGNWWYYLWLDSSPVLSKHCLKFLEINNKNFQKKTFSKGMLRESAVYRMIKRHIFSESIFVKRRLQLIHIIFIITVFMIIIELQNELRQLNASHYGMDGTPTWHYNIYNCTSRSIVFGRADSTCRNIRLENI